MIDYAKVPVKYITGTYIYEESYPTPLDLLYEMATMCGERFKYDKLADVSRLDDDVLESLIEKLSDDGFVKTKNETITVIKTPWDGESDNQ